MHRIFKFKARFCPSDGIDDRIAIFKFQEWEPCRGLQSFQDFRFAEAEITGQYPASLKHDRSRDAASVRLDKTSRASGHVFVVTHEQAHKDIGVDENQVIDRLKRAMARALTAAFICSSVTVGPLYFR